MGDYFMHLFDERLDLLDGKADTATFPLEKFIRITMQSASNLAAFKRMLPSRIVPPPCR